jgi:hypothetical protein
VRRRHFVGAENQHQQRNHHYAAADAKQTGSETD